MRVVEFPIPVLSPITRKLVDFNPEAWSAEPHRLKHHGSVIDMRTDEVLESYVCQCGAILEGHAAAMEHIA